jgi:hypothetical protein
MVNDCCIAPTSFACALAAFQETGYNGIYSLLHELLRDLAVILNCEDKHLDIIQI